MTLSARRGRSITEKCQLSGTAAGHCRLVLDRIRAGDSHLDNATRAKVEAAEAYPATGA
jgi:hypothetical protein